MATAPGHVAAGPAATAGATATPKAVAAAAPESVQQQEESYLQELAGAHAEYAQWMEVG